MAFGGDRFGDECFSGARGSVKENGFPWGEKTLSNVRTHWENDEVLSKKAFDVGKASDGFP